MVKIPDRLEDLIPSGAVEKVLDALQQPDISGKVREALDRVGMRDANPVEHMQQAFRHARNWFESVTRGEQSRNHGASLINATGSLFAPTVTRIPLSTAVARAYADAAVGFLNADYIDEQVKAQATRILGNFHCSWHCSTANAAATLFSARQVVVSKRDLVRIPGLGDIGALLKDSDVLEVGATNGCSREDWLQGFEECRKTPLNACMLLVSPNGQSGETADRDRGQAIHCAKHAGIAVVELLADGVVCQRLTSEFGFPNLKQRLHDDVAAVIAPLQLLVGAPQGALVVGKEPDIVPLKRRTALAGAALAGPELLAAVVAMQLSDSELSDDGPAANLLINPENLRNRAERLAIQLQASEVIREAKVCQRTSSIGPPPWDIYQLQNWAVELFIDGDPEQFRDALLLPSSPKIGAADQTGDEVETAASVSISSIVESGRVLLDLRFVDPKDDHLIAIALASEESNSMESSNVVPANAEESRDVSG